MEAIEYNGIHLKSLQTLRFHTQQVRDEAGNYVCSRHEIELYADYQPAQTSYADGSPPVATFGKLPGETYLATLEKLLTPRGLLKITSGGKVILETPSLKSGGPTRYLTDAANGPFCEFVSAPKQVGIKHWIVHLRFLAHTVICNRQADPLVLSNTWSTAWDVDELYYPTKTVAGKAILRTDLMRDQHTTADNLRASFFFPIPDNYVRTNIHVEVSNDGATLLWSFVDVARCYNIATPESHRHSQIKNIEVYWTTRSDAGTPARARAEFDLSQRISLTGGAGGAISSMYTAAWSAGLSIGSLGALGGQEGRRLANLPSHILNCRCDIWGDRDASNNFITQFSLGVCLQNAFFSAAPFSITTAEVICRQQLTQRFVSSEVTFRWADNLRPGSGVNTSLSADQGGGAVLLTSLFTDYPTISRREIAGSTGTPGAVIPLLTQTTGPNPSPRLNAFGELSNNVIQKTVVQALLSPCGTAGVPSPTLTGDRS